MNAAWLGAVAVAVSVEAMAQGTVLFANSAATLGTASPIYGWVHSPSGWSEVKLDGSAYLAQLWAGSSPTSLAPIGVPLTFRTGNRAGILANEDPVRVINTVPPGGDVYVRVRAWQAALGSTWGEAWSHVNCCSAIGESPVWRVKTGGDGVPPGMPLPLIGFPSFTITSPCLDRSLCPEPSTVALGLLGLATLGWARRR
jgi:hypothetical protein